MANVPYHTHDFTIQTATPADMEALTSTSTIVTPANLEVPFAALTTFTAASSSAVSKPYIKKLLENISVFDDMSASLQDGILSSSVTDSNASEITAAINNILNDYGASVIGEIKFPQGYYPINSTLTVKSGSRLKASGNAILKPVNGSSANPLLFAIANRSDVKISGFTFDGNRPNLSNFNNLITAFQSEKVIFDDCRWKNTRGIAVIFSACTRSGVKDSFFNDCGILNRTTGVSSDRKQAIAYSSGGFHNFADRNYFENVGLDCISFGNEQALRAVGNHIRNTDAGSIYIAECKGGSVTGNNVSNGVTGGNAIDVADSSDLSIASNICIGNGAAGVLLAGEIHNVSVVGNVCKNNVKSASTVHRGGITLHFVSGKSMTDVSISANTCADDQGASVSQRFAVGLLDEGGTRTRINIDRNNTFLGYTSSGVIAETDTFQNQSLGLVSHTQLINLADAATFILCPDTLRGQFSITCVNTGQSAAFAQLTTSGPSKLYDPSSAFVTSDTGTTSAVYRDAATNTIRLKNRFGVARVYLVTLDFSSPK